LGCHMTISPITRVKRTNSTQVQLILLLLTCLVIAPVFANHVIRLLTTEKIVSITDYSNYAEIARISLNGGQMYVDFWTTKPPITFFYLLPFVALWGNTALAISAATVVLLVALVLF